MARLHRSRTRKREGLFLVEGVRSAADALDSAAEVAFAVTAPGLDDTAAGRALRRRLAGSEGGPFDVVDVPDSELARLADTETPQGVLLVCREPGWSLDALDAPDRGGRPAVLVLDAVQDPGNAGTLVRAAAAFGLSGVVALDGTVDPWSPKTVRAAAGSLFRIPVVAAAWEEAGPWLSGRGLTVLVADAAGDDVARVAEELPDGGWAVVVGNEGAGVRDEVRLRADRTVAVPMPGGAESLNVGVAGSILLYVLAGDRGDRS